MVQIDERWDRLKAVREAGFKPPRSHPDIDPSHEALQLRESFRELLRLDESRSRGAEFTRAVEVSERLAADLESNLRQAARRPKAESREQSEAAFDAVAKSCTWCHARHRDH